MRISRILDQIDEHQLFVPAFQREYVWKRHDAKELLDSLIKEYPTGTMLTWETNNPPELKGPHKYDPRQGAVRILLDGQQRITTLYMLIRGKIPSYYSESDVVNDTRGLYMNTETGEFEYYLKTKMDPDPRWQNVTAIFQRLIRSRTIVRKLEEQGEKVDPALDERIDDNIGSLQRILDRDFPEQTIPLTASIHNAINIFYKVNASGVALTEAELALAQISGYWPQAREIFKAKLAELQKEGFSFKLDFLVYVLLGCLYHLGSDMRKLHDPANEVRLRNTWKRLEQQVLDYVINVLRTHAYVDHSCELSSPYVLVPIIVYCFDKQGKHLTATEVAQLVRWFYYAQIRSRYVSQLAQKLDYDLRVVAESVTPFDQLLSVIAQDSRLEITADEFIGRKISHPLFGLMRSYFKSRGALCFSTGVGLRQNAGSKYQLENDHIFPYAALKRAGYGKENRVKFALAQEMTNRAFLTQTANRTKSDEAAYDYLQSVRRDFANALELQSIPQDESLWRIENYEAFLESRRRILASALNEFLNNVVAPDETVISTPVADLITGGESDALEFKSSLRWDYKQCCLNRRLEDVIVKSVSAFANSNGGTLLIGVRDDREILGLERDFQTLGATDSDKLDKFDLHLRNILNHHLSTAYVASKIKIQFPRIAEKEVCQISIQPSSGPLFVRLADKNGQPVERFFVRSGPSSAELSPSEIHQYVKESRARL